jgi:hypothetical protein
MGYAYDQQIWMELGIQRTLGEDLERTKKDKSIKHYKSYKGYIIIGEVHGPDR